MNFEKFDDAPLETGQSLFLNKTLEVKAVFKPNRRKKSWLQKIWRLFPHVIVMFIGGDLQIFGIRKSLIHPTIQ